MAKRKIQNKKRTFKDETKPFKPVEKERFGITRMDVLKEALNNKITGLWRRKR